MGSVNSYINCPNCDSENCFVDFYYKNNEEYTSCSDCGYYKSFFWKRDEDGKLLRKDETKGYEFDNLVSEMVVVDNPYGSYRIKSMFGGSQVGTIKDEEELDSFLSQLREITQSANMVSNITLSRFTNGEIIKTTLYDTNS